MTEPKCQSCTWKSPTLQADGLSWILNSEENKAPSVAVLTLEEASVLIQNEWRDGTGDKVTNDRSLKRILARLSLDSIDERNRLESVVIEESESEAGPEQQPLGEDLLLSLQDLLFGPKAPTSPVKDEGEVQRDPEHSASTHERMQKSIPLMHEVVLAESGIAMFSSQQKLTLKTGSEDSAETGGHASAPSSGSHVSNEFLNSSFAFHQFDCHSDCTESTGTEGIHTQLNGSTVFNRRRLRSGDTVCSEISCGESWEANSSLFGRDHAPAFLSQSQSQAQSYVLPSPPEASPPASRRPETIFEANRETLETSVNQSSSSGAPTISNMLMSQSRDQADAAAGEERALGIAVARAHGSLLNSIHSASLSPSDASHEEDVGPDGEDALMGVSLHSAIVSRALPASEMGMHQPDAPLHSPSAACRDMTGMALEEPSDLSEKTTSPNVTTAPASPTKPPSSPRAGKASQRSGTSADEESAMCLDVLVLPTMLPAPVKNMIYAALGVLQVDVRRAHSTAVALVACFLCAQEGRELLTENDGCVRILVLESSEGFVCASVVAVSSPLDAALPCLATAANTPLNSAASASASEPNSTTGTGTAAGTVPGATVAGSARAGVAAGATPGAAEVGEQGGLEASPRGGEMRLAARSLVLRVESCVWSTYDAPAPAPGKCGSGEYEHVLEPGIQVSRSVGRSVDEGEVARGLEDTGVEAAQEGARKAVKDEKQAHVVDLQAALHHVSKLVMLQQASLHSPFARAPLGSPPPVPTAERRCYSSFELDCRMFGTRVAAQLRDQHQARVEAQFKAVADSDAAGGVSKDDRDGEFSAACPPVPVLDAVLYRPGVPCSAAGDGSELTLKEKVEPYLRRSAERDRPAGEEGMHGWDACRSQITVEGSFVAVRPRQLSSANDASLRREEISAGCAEQVYCMPAEAVRDGARVLGAESPDALRVHECTRVTECDRGRAVSQPAIGVVVRRVPSGSCLVTSTPRVLPEESVCWLFNPAAVPTSAADAAVTRSDRDFCVALYSATNANTTAKEDASITVLASPCRVTRRTYPIKPRLAVTAFVQRPPADNACIVQSSLASHAADWVQSAGEIVCGPAPRTLPPALTATSARASKVPPLQLQSLGAGLVLAGDYSPPALPDDPLEPARFSVITVLTGWCLSAYAAVVQTIRYLIFPAATYYIQYYQADAGVSRDSSGGEDARRIIAVLPACAVVPGTGKWELLVVSKPAAEESETEAREPAMRVLRVIPLSSAPTYCDALMALENGAPEASSTAAFPSCVVSLSAVNSASTRVLSVKRMSGGAIAEAPPLTEQQQRRKSRRASSAHVTDQVKRQFVELTASARELLQRRIHLQKHVQTVRTVLRVLVFVVLFAMSALLLAALVLDDAHLPAVPPSPASDSVLTSQVSLSPALPAKDSKQGSGTLTGGGGDGYCPAQEVYGYAAISSDQCPLTEAQPRSAPQPSCDANATADSQANVEWMSAYLQRQEEVEVCDRASAAEQDPIICIDSCPLPLAEVCARVNWTAAAAQVPSLASNNRRTQPLPVPGTALSMDARSVSGASLHHLMTEYQIRQMRYRQSSVVVTALPDAGTDHGASRLREEFQQLFRALQVHVRTQRRYAQALTVSAGQQLQKSTSQVESQVAQALRDVSSASAEWLEAVKQRLSSNLPVLAGSNEPGMVQRTSAGVAHRVRRVQRALRRVTEMTSTQAQTAYTAVTSTMHQAAEAVLHNATAAVHQLYLAMVRVGQQVCQLNEQVCGWQDRVLHDADRALRAALRKFAAAVDRIFGSM